MSPITVGLVSLFNVIQCIIYRQADIFYRLEETEIGSLQKASSNLYTVILPSLNSTYLLILKCPQVCKEEEKVRMAK